MPKVSILNEAIKYHNAGYSVITVNITETLVNDKYVKKVSFPLKWQTFSYEQCRKFFNKDHNGIILLTGIRHSEKDNQNIKSVIGIDIDKGVKKEDLMATKLCGYEWLKRNPLPDTAIEDTANDGKHYIYEYDGKIENTSSGLFMDGKKYGVDIRSNGGCLIISPSSYTDIQTKKEKKYTWIKEQSILHVKPSKLSNKHVEMILKGQKRPIITKTAKEWNNKTINITPDITVHETYNELEIEELHVLINMMSVERATDYDSWIKMGTALRKYGEDGRKLYHIFSKKCMAKYDEDIVNYKFNSFKYSLPTLDTIRIWAKKDSPIEYKEYRMENYELTYDDDIDINEWLLLKSNFCYTQVKNDKEVIIYSDLFKELAIKYLNHYMCLITDLAETNYGLLHYKNGIVNNITIKRPCQLKEFLKRFDNYFSTWSKSYDVRTFNNIVFEPYPPYKEPKHEKDLNLFYGFNQKYIEKLDININIIQPILDHIKVVLCDNNAVVYEYLLDYLACILQMPNRKNGIALVINGKMGSGKSSFFDFFGKEILGTKYFCYVNNIQDVTGQFTTQICNKLLTVLDECNTFLGNHQLFNQFKTMVTQSTIKLEAKGKDPIFINDYNNFVMISNEYHICKIEQNDRRYLCLEVNNMYAKGSASDEIRKDYFNKLNRAFNDSSVKEHFYNFLLRRDISNRYFEDIPITKYKKELRNLSCPSEILFIHKFYEANKYFNKEYTFIDSDTLYKSYKDFCDKSNYTTKHKASFFQSLSSGPTFLEPTRKAVGKGRVYGYKFNENSKNKILEFLQSKEYTFDDNIEEYIDSSDDDFM